MPRSVERFLKHAPILEEGPTLGRVFAVTRESWALSDDPRKVGPQTETLASRRTASDAADYARAEAQLFPEHGFHKPSAAWWGSDGVRFHRFVVHAGRRRRTGAILVGSGVAGLTVLALVRLLWRPRRPAGAADGGNA
jgi:hypothetical protein